MSCSLYKWKTECEFNPYVGDCDNCPKAKEQKEEEEEDD